MGKIDWTKEGECTKCHRIYRLAKDGSIWFHYRGARNTGRCDGAGLPPVARNSPAEAVKRLLGGEL